MSEQKSEYELAKERGMEIVQQLRTEKLSENKAATLEAEFLTLCDKHHLDPDSF